MSSSICRLADREFDEIKAAPGHLLSEGESIEDSLTLRDPARYRVKLDCSVEFQKWGVVVYTTLGAATGSGI
jgi:hypothetical protein